MLSLPVACIPTSQILRVSGLARIRREWCFGVLHSADRSTSWGLRYADLFTDEDWPRACLIADPHGREAREWHALYVDAQSTAPKQLQLFVDRGAQHLGWRDTARAHAHDLQSRAPQH
jgi:hypothetical protein